ncbi:MULTISPECIES: oligopeptide ABC transporter permease [Psychrobacillus]|uniref:ABC transporter permease n=1 Tax=Psychrobacillus faecigallinarum TaxID=2762235 RepID=A0ABR8R593_9BACI|nr:MULTISPECIES: oligopeptide ABC transporter permease [Psychrobacillus]MBD7942960.1 ABC transporter permease [Psychrobacillus faecigallinarum]QEY20421.1 ABC transporter permease [Psychrobacillus sp. AK 1817]QGM30956.1 ABC transporter permease subunit [Bacillus sp. N3536]
MSQDLKKLPAESFNRVQVDSSQAEKISKPSVSFWKDAWYRIRKNKAAIVSVFILLIILVMSLIGPHIGPHDAETQTITHANLPPKVPGIEKLGIMDGYGNLAGKEVDLYELKKVDTYYWFGTDGLGRDMFARVWEGTQVSLFIAFMAALIDMVIGVAYGGISGYYGGRVDDVMQRIVEILIGIPNLVIVILMIMFMDPGITAIIIAITITGWIGMSRVVRAQVLKYKNQEFVLAARTLGASNNRIITKHILPNVLSIVVINTMFTIPSAIFFEAFLSFIGLGLQPPAASLGTLINDGVKLLKFQPHILVYPAVIISLLMLSFNLLGDGLRDALDPKMKD